MDIKTCFKCGRSKSLTEFYKHAQMADGHLNKCKACTKRDVHNHRIRNPETVRANDRKRDETPQRKQWKIKQQRITRAREPEKYKARTAVGNAIRDGRLQRQQCRVCGAKAEAHHHDYAKPLEVDWLCRRHHQEHHQTL